MLKKMFAAGRDCREKTVEITDLRNFNLLIGENESLKTLEQEREKRCLELKQFRIHKSL